MSTDPNNDSPLNAYAANLWADQDGACMRIEAKKVG